MEKGRRKRKGIVLVVLGNVSSEPIWPFFCTAVDVWFKTFSKVSSRISASNRTLVAPMNSARQRQNYATILGNPSIGDVKFSTVSVSGAEKLTNSFPLTIDTSMVSLSQNGNSMPSEGAILADNDPRKAATKELRSLINTQIDSCLASMGRERSGT